MPSVTIHSASLAEAFRALDAMRTELEQLAASARIEISRHAQPAYARRGDVDWPYVAEVEWRMKFVATEPPREEPDAARTP